MTEPAVYVLEKMAHGYKRMGRAAGAGFYDYGSEPPALWSGLKTFERRKANLAETDIRDRLLHAAIRAALAVAPDGPPSRVGSVFGRTLPADRAQAQAVIASLGESAFESRSADLAARFGPRFAAAAAGSSPVGDSAR